MVSGRILAMMVSIEEVLATCSNEMPVHGFQLEATPNRVRKVIIHQDLYPTTKIVLHQVFAPYGVVEAVEIL